MSIFLFPLGGAFPHVRTPELSSTRALRQVLDVRTKARGFDYSESFGQQLFEGNTSVQWLLRTVVYILGTPVRVALSIIFGLAQLLNECPRYGLRDQPRLIKRILSSTLKTAFRSLGGCMMPFFFPGSHIRTFNITDVRSASLYTQRKIPRVAAAGLFGWFPSNRVDSAIPVTKMSAVCWGQSLWMAAMHLHGEPSCPDSDQRARALARNYQMGASPEATLLQELGDHTYVRIALFEWLLNRLVDVVKPTALFSVYRGSRQWARGSEHSLLAEITRAYRLANETKRALSEQACLAHLVNLRVCGTQRFKSGVQPSSWGAWLKSFWVTDMRPYQGIGRMADGVYMMTSENDQGRHAVLYIRSQKGKHGVFFDPNVGLELGAEGADHWKALISIAARCGHQTVTFTRLKKRGVCDLSSLDIRRRFAELVC